MRVSIIHDLEPKWLRNVVVVLVVVVVVVVVAEVVAVVVVVAVCCRSSSAKAILSSHVSGHLVRGLPPDAKLRCQYRDGIMCGVPARVSGNSFLHRQP